MVLKFVLVWQLLSFANLSVHILSCPISEMNLALSGPDCCLLNVPLTHPNMYCKWTMNRSPGIWNCCRRFICSYTPSGQLVFSFLEKLSNDWYTQGSYWHSCYYPFWCNGYPGTFLLPSLKWKSPDVTRGTVDLCSAGPPMGLMQGLLPRPLAKARQQICHLCRPPKKCLPLPRALKGCHGVSHQLYSSGPWIWQHISLWSSTEQDPEGSLSLE